MMLSAKSVDDILTFFPENGFKISYKFIFLWRQLHVASNVNRYLLWKITKKNILKSCLLIFTKHAQHLPLPLFGLI